MLIFDQLRRGDRRLRALAIAILAGFLVLFTGLWYVQIASARRFQASLKTQTFRTVRIPAVRGKVLDRNGAVLAENRPSYHLNLYLEELRPFFAQEFTRLRAGRRLGRAERDQLSLRARSTVASNLIQRASHFLQQPLRVDDRDFRRHHNQWPYRPFTLLENLSPAQIARFLEQTPDLPGVDLEVQPVRYYPPGPAVAHLLGYLTRDDLARDEDEAGFSYSLPSYEGAIGIEYAFNRELSGRPGVKSVVVNSLSYRESETVWTTAEPGLNVVLALDLPLQQAAWDALRTLGPSVRGAVVVLDTTVGDVLALVSSPAYDPNEFVAPVSEVRWRELNDPKLRPMFNRSTQGAYPPGSIFKILTALACLDAGLNPLEIYTVMPDPQRPGRGAYWLGRRKIEDTVPAGDYDFRRAFQRSSNAYFIHHGLQAGRERLLRMGRQFLLGQRTGLPTRQEVAGYFPEPEEVAGIWTDGNLANVCIGQEITTTPIQMAVVTAAIANGGRLLQPRLALRLDPAEAGAERDRAQAFAPAVRGTVSLPTAWLRDLREAMLADTEDPEGTGFAAFQQTDRATGRVTPRLPGFRVAGKTGTAQIMKGSAVVDHITWFVAFGPYEDPRYAVVVMVESGGSGGATCAPVARRVFEALQSRRLAPAAAQRLAGGP